MNSLGVELKKGQTVILEGDCPKELRTVIVDSGYGMSLSSRGTALFVKHFENSENIFRVDAMEIESLVPIEEPT